jgi:Domain of unknown function (DUF4129)
MAAVFAVAHATAAGPCVTLQYLAALGRADAAISTTTPDPASAAAILANVEISTPSARATLTPIVDDLDAAPPDLGDARAWLGDLVQVLALPNGAACSLDPAPARAALHDVYASPVFANLDQKTSPSFLQQILNWLASLFNSTGRALGTAGSIALGAVVLALALAFAAWRLRGNLGSSVARIREQPEEDSDDPNREWTLADRAAGRGEYREAIRRAFRSALLDVAWRGRLAVDASWTTRDLLAAARGDADLLAALAPAAALFDRVWYSGERVGEADWTLARARCEAVRSLARSKPRASAS